MITRTIRSSIHRTAAVALQIAAVAGCDGSLDFPTHGASFRQNDSHSLGDRPAAAGKLAGRWQGTVQNNIYLQIETDDAPVAWSEFLEREQAAIEFAEDGTPVSLSFPVLTIGIDDAVSFPTSAFVLGEASEHSASVPLKDPSGMVVGWMDYSTTARVSSVQRSSDTFCITYAVQQDATCFGGALDGAIQRYDGLLVFELRRKAELLDYSRSSQGQAVVSHNGADQLYICAEDLNGTLQLQ